MARPIVFLVTAFLFFAVPCMKAAEARVLKIVAGTSLIEDIVRDLTGDRVEMKTLIAGSSCPGHDNANPADFVFAAKADVILLHAFQRSMPQVTAVTESVKSSGMRLEIVETGGTWLVPEVQREALRIIAEILVSLSPEDEPSIKERKNNRLAKIAQAESDCMSRLAAFKDTPVVAAGMQADFVRWAGFNVLETYRRSEEMTPRDVANLVDFLRGRKIAGVIDNFQSGSDAGLPLALELKIPHIVLSNFPGFTEDAPDYFSLLRYNVKQLTALGG